MSDTKAAQLAVAKQQAAAKATAFLGGQRQLASATLAAQKLQANANTTTVVGTGPFGLPTAVTLFGVQIPTLAILAVAAVVVMTGAALAVHAARSSGGAR